ncbi:MAG: MBL fold metallo-hydrolase [Candidatus Helarchaeota archaeon]
MKIYKKGGFHIETDDFHVCIDPTSIRAANEADLVLISHSHSDHIKSIEKIHTLKILSQPTLEVLQAKSKKCENVNNYKILDPSDPDKDTVEIDDIIKIRGFPAGHCIGSLQFLLEFQNEKFLYTGDFCLEKRLGFKTASIHEIKGGTLIIDPTYSEKEYVFPERNDLYKKIYIWLKNTLSKTSNLFLIGRQLGTCQELTRLINYSTFKGQVYAHPSVYKINEVHSSYSNLGRFEYKKDPFELEQDNCMNNLEQYCIKNDVKSEPNGKKKSIFLLPFYYIKRIKELSEKFGRRSIAIFTGWAMTRKFSIQAFPLTSHAGYNHIMEYYKQSKAQKMYYF